MIDRELLKKIGFVRIDDWPGKKAKEVWVLNDGPWSIFVGYGDYEGAPCLHGDVASVSDLIGYIMADAEAAIAEIKAGDDW